MPRLAITKILDIRSSVEAIARDEPAGEVKQKAMQIARVLRAAERGSVTDQAIAVAEDSGRSANTRIAALELLLMIGLAEQVG